MAEPAATEKNFAQAPPALAGVLPMLEQMFGNEIAVLMSTPPPRMDRTNPDGPGLVLGAPIWGRKYLERFALYCLPSILAEHNLRALADRSRLMLYTDKETFPFLWNEIRAAKVEQCGVEVVIRLIPQELIDAAAAEGLNKYWILGVCQNAIIQTCGRADLAFHALHPDHIYSERYFENLFHLAERYDGLCQTGISANHTSASVAELEAFRQEDGSLAIPPLELGDWGWRHIHKQSGRNMMNHAQWADPRLDPTAWGENMRLPDSHFMAWQGKDRLALFCCHMNAVYLSPTLCAEAPTRVPATVDAELPRFMSTNNFHVITKDDGMVFMEISDDSKTHEEHMVPFDHFGRRFWVQVRFTLDYMPWNMQCCDIPIKPQEVYLPDETITGQHAFLMDKLLEVRARLSIEFIESLAYQ